MAWELRDSPFIVIGILHKEDVPVDMMFDAMMLEKAGWRALIRFEKDKPFDLSRSLIATEALEKKAEWLFFWDTDVFLPGDAIQRLVAHNLPIVTGIYYRRHPPVPTPASLFRYGPDKVFHPLTRDEVRPQRMLFEVDGCGAGCLLIHRRVLESLKDEVARKEVVQPGQAKGIHYYEFFKWQMGEKSPGYSEDLDFCDKARRKGWRIFADPNVNCGHMVKMMIVDGEIRWTPLETG